ncbi:MAG TPA: NAD-dependent epimerase/dehydratase family protein [Nitrospiria bacterium]
MKVLVSGNAGFIGTFLTQALMENRREVVGIDIRPCNPKDHHYESILGDVRNPDDVMKAAQGADVIMHLAAEHQDFGVTREAFFSVNVKGTRTLVECATRLGIKKFIFYSTVAVYGNAGKVTTEETPPRPVSDYGESKLEAEKVLYAWAHDDPSREVVILRPTVVFGPRNYANMYNLMESIYKNRFIFVGRGRNIKSVAYVENLVAATLFLLERMGPGVMICNYSDTPQLTTARTVEILSRHLSRRVPKFKVPLMPALVAASAFDLLSKLTGYNFPVTAYRIKKFNTDTHHAADAIRALGFKPPVDLEEGFRRMAEWRMREAAEARFPNESADR